MIQVATWFNRCKRERTRVAEEVVGMMIEELRSKILVDKAPNNVTQSPAIVQ